MYKLYGNVAGWKYLDIAFQEEEIIATMIDYVNHHSSYEFVIVYKEKDETIKSTRIATELEFKKYLEDYKSRKNEEVLIKKR